MNFYIIIIYSIFLNLNFGIDCFDIIETQIDYDFFEPFLRDATYLLIIISDAGT